MIKPIVGNYKYTHIINYFRNNMSSIRSKVYFIVLTALLVGGLPNFMPQEAFAATSSLRTGITAGDSTATTNIVVVFTTALFANDGTNGVNENKNTLFTVSGNTVTTANIIARDNDACTGGGTTSVTLVLGTALETDATPTVAFANTGNTVETCDGGSNTTLEGAFGATTTTDGLSPALSSAVVTTTTTIDVTFSEDLDAATIVAGDFTVTNPTRTISGVSEGSAGVVTLTLSSALSDSDTPTVTVVGTSAGIDDTTAQDNTITTGNVVSSSGFTTAVVDATGGSSGNKHNTKPTFGLDPKTHIQLIEDGFSFNGVPTDISDNYWTPYEQQNIKLGELNEFETKVFASQKLRVQEFLFGIPVVGKAHNAELGVEVHYDHSGEIEKIMVIQKTNIIDIDSVQIEKIESKCKADDADERCITTQLQMKFLEPLQGNVMAMKAIDFKGRVSNYIS